MTRFKSFTLVEALLVLVIVALFLLIPISRFEHLKGRYQEEQFIRRFEQEFLYTQQMAVVTGHYSYVYYRSATPHFLFQHRFEGETVFREAAVIFPSSVQRQIAPISLSFSGGSGRVGTLVVYKFRCKYLNYSVQYQLQMGSGRYTKTILAY